jgi:2,3-bisphosphoglycerate-dependent phosphoglycerate mutase
MKLFFYLMLMATCTACSTTYYIVRHADRDLNLADPPLNELGLARANVLRDSLLSKGIDTLFVSNKIRATQTAEPLSIAINKTMRLYLKDTTDGLVAALKKVGNKEVLVVGHSETIPDIIFKLTGQTVPAIGASDFDNFYKVVIKGETKTVQILRYGAVTN